MRRALASLLYLRIPFQAHAHSITQHLALFAATTTTTTTIITQVLLQDSEGNPRGAGVSHYGCSTGPYEQYSPSKGMPWCDTVKYSFYFYFVLLIWVGV